MKQKKEKARSVKSQLPLHLTVRGPNYEFSIDAPISTMMKDLQKIREVMNAINQTLSGVSTNLPGATFPEAGLEEAPIIKASRSTIDNIQSLFETRWGQGPRSVADVLKALEANAVPDTTTAVAVCLLRLVKKHVLRRTRKSGKWQYYKLPAG